MSVVNRGVGFKPTQINGLINWWRADVGVSVDLSGRVQSWDDQSGSGVTLSQATAGTRPTFKAYDSVYNGKSTVQFNGAQQLTSPVLATTLTQPCSLVVVGHTSTGTGQQGFLGGQGGSDLLVYYQFNYRVYAGAAIVSSVTDLAPTAIIGLMNTANSTLYVNSSAASVAGGTVGSGTASQLTVGEYVGGTAFLTGAIAEIMIFNRVLSQVEMSWIFRYLSARYKPGTWA